MASPIPPARGNQVLDSQPPVDTPKSEKGKGAQNESLLIGRPRSNSLPAQLGKGLDQRTHRPLASGESAPSIQSPRRPPPPKNSAAVNKAQAAYDKQLVTYRQVHTQKWLLDNNKYIKQCLNDPEMANKAPFKLYVVIDGKKCQIIPECTLSSGDQQKKVRTYAKQILGQTLKEVPKKQQLVHDISELSKLLALSLKQLGDMGAVPRLQPEAFLARSGVRLDIHDGQPPTVNSYDLDDVEPSKTEQYEENDDELPPVKRVDIEDVDLSEKSEEEEEEEE